MNKFAIKESDRLRSSKRGHRAQTVQQLVAGEYHSYQSMGDHLGISKPDAERLWNNAKRRGVWPIGWEDIR